MIETQEIRCLVVTCNQMSLSGVAGDGACLINPCDVIAIRAGILGVFADIVSREDLVEKGFWNVRKYNPETVAQQYAAFFHENAGG
jgi:hypothetical protein